VTFFLAERDRQPELMDQPGLERDAHYCALHGLRTTNSLSGTSRVVWRGIQEAGIQASNGNRLRILDIAAGGGDVVLGVAKRAARCGVEIEAHGCDINPDAVAYAQQAARRAGVSHAKFFQFNALVDPVPDDYDVVMCTLFLHHLTNDDIRKLLGRMAQATRGGVLVDDLRRNRLGYFLAWAGGRLLTRSHIVHVDGPLSVRAAFTIDEMRNLAESAGLSGVQFRKHWPERFLMTWRRS
jgi:2-polyprenyl-3-methyl-5-hydroxy-6-metoxy-1,4-benzoquinol methylase